MDLEPQAIINALFAVIGGLGGWVLNNLRRAIEGLRAEDSALAAKVQAIEVLVAGDYVRRDEMDRFAERLFSKLDRIEQKVDGKADKQ